MDLSRSAFCVAIAVFIPDISLLMDAICVCMVATMAAVALYWSSVAKVALAQSFVSFSLLSM